MHVIQENNIACYCHILLFSFLTCFLKSSYWQIHSVKLYETALYCKHCDIENEITVIGKFRFSHMVTDREKHWLGCLFSPLGNS